MTRDAKPATGDEQREAASRARAAINAWLSLPELCVDRALDVVDHKAARFELADGAAAAATAAGLLALLELGDAIRGLR
ncbi:MAG: hypothetical protein ACR2JV_06215 [Gaiellales bacterium]